LGETFDIHGGGIDLVFPHHENEIAQSRCAFHTNVMANFWMHNGFLQVEGEKMAKSAGNFVTIRELLTGWRGLPWAGDAIRFAMLTAHYAQPIDWTDTRLAEAGANLHTFRLVGIKGLGFNDETDLLSIPEIAHGRPSDGLLQALYDDLNTPSAIFSHLFKLVRAADSKDGVLEAPAKQLLIDCLFLGVDPFRYYRNQMAAYDAGKIQYLVDQRIAARKAKDFKKSDEIRDELAKMGVVLKDSKDGTTWEIAR
jgi:cysteinyl-tRNA synthetase